MRLYEEDEDATRYTLPLTPKKVVKKTVKSVMVFLFLWSFVIFTGASIAYSLWPNFSVILFWSIVLTFLPALALIPVFYRYQQLYFRTYYYNLKSDVMIIRKGVWAPHEIRLPYSKIQNVYVDRDLLDVVFKLYDVHLATADSASNLYAHVDGLDEENALKLRDMLLKRIEKSPKTTDGV